MSAVEVTIEGFRCAFPEFSLANYPDNVICRFLTMAQAYCSTVNFRIKPATRILLIQLMAAHLITLANISTDGSSNGMASSVGVETSASVDGVSVSRLAPPVKNGFDAWIQSTGYGQQYWALLTAVNPTGVHYVGVPNAFGIR